MAWLALPAGLVLLLIAGEVLRTNAFVPIGLTIPYTGTIAIVIGILTGLAGMVALTFGVAALSVRHGH